MVKLQNTTLNADVRVQLEYGTEASPFESFDGYTTHPVSADGTVDGLMSICPTTVLCADDDTVNISMAYYKNEGNGEESDDRYDEGYEDGKNSVYDTFWDNFQDYGKRESYWYAFAGKGWNDNNFKPKYPMKPTNAQSMFEASFMEQPLTEDIVDFSKSTNFYTTFRDSKFKELGVINASSNSGAFSYTFANMSNCEKIKKFILPDMVNKTVNKFNDSTFQKMNNLTYIRFEGVIANMGANFGHSKNLDKDSIINIVSSHSDTSMTATFSKIAVNNAFETEEGKADGSSSEEWLNLIATRPNVKFTLG